MRFFIALLTVAIYQINVFGDSSPALFDYGIVIDAQKKCDGMNLEKLPLAANRKSIFMIASRTIVVISDLSLKEVKRNKKPERGDTRDFELRYKLYAQLACGEEPRFVSGSGNDTIELPVVEHAWKDPRHLAIVGDETGEDDFAPSLSVNFTANDLPRDPKINGLGCLVEKADFLKSDTKTLAKKMCGSGVSADALKKIADGISVVKKAITDSGR